MNIPVVSMLFQRYGQIILPFLKSPTKVYLTVRSVSTNKQFNMRFVQFSTPSDPSSIQVGVRVNDQVIPITNSAGGPTTLLELLKNGGVDAVADVIKSSTAIRIPLSSVQLKAPIVNPDKVICVGMNYKDHCEEQNVPVPLEPIIFSKFSSTIVGPSDPIIYPEVTKELDFEVELAVVIGKKGKNVSAENALEYVLGYTVAHDVSARDWQLRKNGGQWLLGKTMDAFCPLGPEIVTKDEIPDPHVLSIKCVLNQETVQDSNTSQLVHKVEAVVAWISRFFTLLPGDVILTGTPPGVGVFRKPPVFLKVGDVVECSIEKIGSIKNEVIAENN